MRWISLILLFFEVDAWAAIPSFCGDTVRGLASEACPSPDGDNDGYTTDGTGEGYDCDDTNMWVYPTRWSTAGCSAGEAKRCGTDGSFGACQTFTSADCEATGSGRCYWIDQATGSDSTSAASNDDSAPWKTFQNISGQNVSSGLPVKPTNWVDLAPGDVVYVSGTFTEVDEYTVTNGTTNYGTFVFGLQKQQRGDATNRLAVKEWPGRADWVISPTGTGWGQGGSKYGFYVTVGDNSIDGQYLDIVGPEVIGISGNIGIDQSNYTKLYDAEVHGIFTVQGASAGAIHITTSRYVGVYRSVIYDNYDTTSSNGSEWNAGIRLFRGRGIELKWNVIGYTPAVSDSSTPNHGTCMTHKHGSVMALPMDPTYVQYNACFNAVALLQSGQPSTRVSYNRAISSRNLVSFVDGGGPTQIADEVVEFNTLVGSGQLLDWDPTDYYNESANDSSYSVGANICSGNLPMGSVTLNNNVMIGTTTGDFLSINYNRSNYFWTNIWQAGLLVADNNCYYSSGNANGQFSIMSTNDATVECTGYTRDQGFAKTFVQWQAEGQDAASFNKTANLDSDHIAQDTDCDDKGWRLPGGGYGGTTIKGGLNFRSGGRL